MRLNCPRWGIKNEETPFEQYYHILKLVDFLQHMLHTKYFNFELLKKNVIMLKEIE